MATPRTGSHLSPAPGMAPVSLGVPAQMPNVRFRVFIPRYWQAMVRTEGAIIWGE